MSGRTGVPRRDLHYPECGLDCHVPWTGSVASAQGGSEPVATNLHQYSKFHYSEKVSRARKSTVTTEINTRR